MWADRYLIIFRLMGLLLVWPAGLARAQQPVPADTAQAAPVVVQGGADPEAVAACARRFRSYDARSGTYLGNDGARHPCP